MKLKMRFTRLLDLTTMFHQNVFGQQPRREAVRINCGIQVELVCLIPVSPCVCPFPMLAKDSQRVTQTLYRIVVTKLDLQFPHSASKGDIFLFSDFFSTGPKSIHTHLPCAV